MTAFKTIRDLGLKAVLETALDAVVVMRMDGSIAGWSRHAEATLGWSQDEALGRKLSDLIIPESLRESHERGLAHYLATGEGPVLNHRIEVSACRKGGGEVPVELSITCTRDGEDKVFLGFLRDISDRREAERRQELTIGELNHRVKNLLSVGLGIATQTMRSARTLEDFLPAFSGRLRSLARAHDLLVAGGENASLRALAEDLVATFADGEAAKVSVTGPDVKLPARMLLALSMILHELLSNAIKYGALARSEGRILLDWAVADGALSLTWRETGVPGVGAPGPAGFGTRMIDLSARSDLGATVEREWRDDGLDFRMSFALPAEAS